MNENLCELPSAMLRRGGLTTKSPAAVTTRLFIVARPGIEPGTS